MFKNSKNYTFLLYVFISVMMVNMFACTLEAKIRNEMQTYQEDLVDNISTVIDDCFEIKKRHAQSYIQTVLNGIDIEELKDEAERIIKVLENFEYYDEDIEDAFIYFDDGKIVGTNQEKYEKIVSNTNFNKTYETSKKFGDVAISDMIDDEICMVSPLYNKSDEFLGCGVFIFSTGSRNRLVNNLINEQLIGNIKISQSDKIIFDSSDGDFGTFLYHEKYNKTHNITISSGIAYSDCSKTGYKFLILKNIARLFIMIMLFLVITTQMLEKKIRKSEKKKLNVIFFVFMVGYFFIYSILLTNYYVEYMKNIRTCHIKEISAYLSTAEQLDYVYTTGKLKSVAKIIESDTEKFNINEAKNRVLKDYNSYIYGMIMQKDMYNRMIVLLNDSRYLLIPDLEINDEILYKNNFIKKEYYDDDIYYLELNIPELQDSGIIATKLMVGDENIGLIGCSISKKYYRKKINKYFNMDNIYGYLIDNGSDNIYMINDLHLVKSNTIVSRVESTKSNKNDNDDTSYGIETYNIDGEKNDYFYVDLKMLNSRLILKENYDNTNKNAYNGLISTVVVFLIITISLLIFYSNTIYKLSRKDGNANEPTIKI